MRTDPIEGVSRRAWLAGVTLALALAGCATPALGPPSAPGGSAAGQAGSAQPAAAAQPPAAPGEHPAAPVPKPFHLGPAATALVAQAQHQAASGDYGTAAATLERAVRIEPDNPLVWIELGRVHLAEGDSAQADALGHKALALATVDPAAQASAWRLIADALRARGRNADAADADRHALSLAPH